VTGQRRVCRRRGNGELLTATKVGALKHHP
jgi:hypothetical protein